MSLEFESLYRNYLLCRKASAGPPLEEKRWVKGALASFLEENPDELDWYFQGRLSDKRYRDVVLRVSDYSTCDERVEPTLGEAVLTTELLKKTEERIIEDFSTVEIDALFRIGSLRWAPYYWINHPKSGGKKSDLDFEVIADVKKIESLKEVSLYKEDCLFETSLNSFLALYKRNEADYWTYHKEDPEGFVISVHFVPFSVYELICSTNYAELKKTLTIREFRPKERSSYIYHQRGFDGKEVTFNSEVSILNEGVVFTVPLAIVDNNGNFALGYPLDKYLSGRIIVVDNPLIEKDYNHLERSIAKRLALERDLREGKDLRVSNAFSRTGRMNPFIKQEIDTCFDRIIAELSL